MSYKKKRDELIRTKGYDADAGRPMLVLSVIVLIGGAAVVAGNLEDSLIFWILGAVPGVAMLAFFIIKRSKAIGVADAISITMDQIFGMTVGAFAWFVKTIWGMFNGFTSKSIDDGVKQSKARQEAERKAALMREYEASVAAIERGSDEIADLTGETDAAIAQATADYEHKADMIDHEYKG